MWIELSSPWCSKFLLLRSLYGCRGIYEFRSWEEVTILLLIGAQSMPETNWSCCHGPKTECQSSQNVKHAEVHNLAFSPGEVSLTNCIHNYLYSQVRTQYIHSFSWLLTLIVAFRSSSFANCHKQELYCLLLVHVSFLEIPPSDDDTGI